MYSLCDDQVIIHWHCPSGQTIRLALSIWLNYPNSIKIVSGYYLHRIQHLDKIQDLKVHYVSNTIHVVSR